MCHYAKCYARENGDLEAPKRHVTKEGFSLGLWIQTQWLVHAGKTPGLLTTAQVKLPNVRQRSMPYRKTQAEIQRSTA